MIVAVRNVDNTVHEQQSRPLQGVLRIEGNNATRTVDALAWNCRLNEYRPAKFLCPCGDVDGVEIMIKGPVVIDVSVEVHRPRRSIDSGRARDPDNRIDVAGVGSN